MPDFNPKEAGDNVFPQYNRIIRIPVGAGAITKGELYTLSATGYLVSAGATRTDFKDGLYQPVEDVPAGTAGDHTVQVLGPGSRVLLKAPAGLLRNSLVEYTGTTNILKKWTVTASATSADLYAKVGRLFGVYVNDEVTEKRVTEANDLVIVELGQS